MIKRTILPVLILLFGLTSLSSFAQNAEPKKKNSEAVYFTNISECQPKDVVNRILRETYKEEPILIGKAGVTGSEGKIYEGLMLFYANIAKSSFTIVLYFPDDKMACILTTGIELQPMPQSSDEPSRTQPPSSKYSL